MYEAAKPITITEKSLAQTAVQSISYTRLTADKMASPIHGPTHYGPRVHSSDARLAHGHSWYLWMLPLLRTIAAPRTLSLLSTYHSRTLQRTLSWTLDSIAQLPEILSLNSIQRHDSTILCVRGGVWLLALDEFILLLREAFE